MTRAIERPYIAGGLVGHETMSFYDKKGHLKLLACELNEHSLKRKFVWLTQLIHVLSLDSTVGKENNV